MRQSNDQPLKVILQQWLKTYRHRARLNQTRVAAIWSKMMGPTIAGYTRDVYIRKGTLYITIEASSLRQELSYAKEKIKNNINERLGEDVIKEVVIR